MSNDSPAEEPAVSVKTRLRILEHKSEEVLHRVSELRRDTDEVILLTPRLIELEQNLQSFESSVRNELADFEHISADLSHLETLVEEHNNELIRFHEDLVAIRDFIVQTNKDERNQITPVIDKITIEIAQIRHQLTMKNGDSASAAETTSQRTSDFATHKVVASTPRKQLSDGHYDGWSYEAENFSLDDFVSWDDLNAVMRVLRKLNFSVKAHRDEAIKLLDSLDTISPVATETSRFPDRLYANVTVGIVADLLAKLRSSYDFGERYVDNATPADKRFGSQDDAKLTTVKIAGRLLEMSRQHPIDRLHLFGVFSVRSFENKFSLSWIN